MTEFGSFDNSTCKRVLDLLQPGDLTLGQVVIKRVAAGHQLGQLQVCTSLQTDNHASTPLLGFCHSCRVMRCWCGYLSGVRCRLFAYGPADATHTHTFDGPLFRTTQVTRYQKGKTDLNFTEARDSEWQWHQLGQLQVCISLQTDNHASRPTPPLRFLQAGCPSCRPTNSIKALKASPADATAFPNPIISCLNPD